MCIDFRLDGRLVASSIVDLGANWMNAVYFYFDPDENKRSLGTFNIMSLVNTCLEMGMDFLYLGYFIEGVGAMSYKQNFHPHQLFLNNQWRLID
jgi:arginine-tRNA-protein transferase